ncbi:MAG: iron-containing alcohol dehydrogenase [Parvibaculales bacterium]
MNFQFNTVKNILFGVHKATELSAIIQQDFDAKNIFIVTDSGISASGLLTPVLEGLSRHHQVLVFSDVVADPPEQTVLDCLELAKNFAADLVVGFGGGSSMDTAKLIAVLLGTDQSLSDMYGVDQVTDDRKIPLILVPTTAGTGSEVTPISIVTTGETTKMGVVSSRLYADMAVLDPSLTLGLPHAVTAATGIDAMVHAIEAFTSKYKKNPVSDMCARQALVLLRRGLPRVLADGSDLEARSDMLLGAMLAGQAFANAPVAAVHALAYPIGGIFHVSHGLSNALVLPSVLRFNASVAAPLYASLAELFDPAATGGDMEMSERFICELEHLIDISGIETRLSQLGIGSESLEQLAEDAMLQTRLLQNNPRDVSYDDALSIYETIL